MEKKKEVNIGKVSTSQSRVQGMSNKKKRTH